MSARTTKQILYGAFFLIVFAAFSLWFYAVFLAPKPTCFDGIRNQREDGVDCGGPCLSCSVKELDLFVKQKVIIPVESLSRTTFFVEVENPSVDFWVKRFGYSLRAYNSLGIVIVNFRGVSYVSPGGTREIAYVAEDFDPRDVREFDFEIINEEWASIDDYEDAGIRVTRGAIEERNGKVIIPGVVRNSSSDPISLLRVGAVFYDGSGKFADVSTTVIENFEALSSRGFEIALIPANKNVDFGSPRIFTEILK